MGTLFVVGTPIGNLEDISLRALRVLKEVDVILCEDTRVTKRLLEKYEIKDKQLFAYNEQKSGIKIEKVIELLKEGKNVALVSDAGTPGISDPGAKLVSLIVEKFRSYDPKLKTSELQNFPTIVSVPGPSALTAALSISGIPSDNFLFLGFLPHKKGRETLFKEISESKRPVVFYESPHRIIKTLESLGKFEPQKSITTCRELTKVYEEVKSGTPQELLEYYKTRPEKIRGEFVVIVV